MYFKSRYRSSLCNKQVVKGKMAGSASDVTTHEVRANAQVGRYMIAGKDLEPGEEILTELPFVVGPKSSTYPLCLSCYTPWPADPDKPTLCSKCRWPVCNEICENADIHKEYECPIFQASKEVFNIKEALASENQNGIPQLECITHLRLLLASEKFPERWNKEVKNLEAHNKKRIESAQWKIDDINIVKFMRERLKLMRFTEECIQMVCGILEINCHEIRTSAGYGARAVYPTMALMNHSCVSNTSHTVHTGDYRVRLRTTIRVAKGSELFGSYTHSLLPTMLRQEHLLVGKYFQCACARCSDPTELGTHMSSLKCNKCDNGVVVSLDSLDPESMWKCTHCEFSTSGPAVKKVCQIINAEVEAVEAISGDYGPDAIYQREKVMKKYHSVLHPRHAFLTILRHSLSQLYGRVAEYDLDDLPDIVLEHKVDMCRLLLQVIDVIEPGLSRIRGMILYELHAPLLFLAKSQWNAGVLDDPGLKSKMTEAAMILKEAGNILTLEPEDSAEGKIGIVAKESLTQLEQSINDL